MSLSALRKTKEVWEVGVLPAPIEVGGRVVERLLVVVERSTGAVRLGGEVRSDEAYAAVFRSAFLSPEPPCVPSRPRRVVFRDPALRQRLGGVLEEAGVSGEVTAVTPALAAGITRLMHHAGGPRAPGIDREIAAWRAALAAFLRSAPWEVCGLDTLLTFRGGGLDDHVAEIMGAEGGVRAVILHPKAGDLPWLDAADRAPTLHLMLESAEALSPDEVERCLRLGLQFPPGLYPRVYASHRDLYRGATADEQALLLAAAAAVAAVDRASLLAEGRRVPVTVERAGSIEVTVLPERR